MNISDHINEIKKRADAATKSEWDSRLSHDIYKTPYVMIDPGYFIWPHFVDNLVTKALNKKPNFTNDIAFISHARTDVPKLVEALELAIETLRKYNEEETPGIPAEKALIQIEKIFEGEQK